MLDHLVQVIGNNKTPANQEVIYPRIDSQPGELIDLFRIHIVRINKDRERPLPLIFLSQQGLVNKLLHSLLPLVVNMLELVFT
jgi:hypothetical protein